MKKSSVPHFFLTITLALVLITLSPFRAVAREAHQKDASGHSHEAAERHLSSHEHSSSGSPLVAEMNILDAAFREIVSAVSLGDGQRVHQALEPMHGTMEKTHEGVHHGTVKLRKNADKMEAFVKMDKAFHGELEKLAGAAHKNDRKVMLSITQELLKGCVDCHSQYRP